MKTLLFEDDRYWTKLVKEILTETNHDLIGHADDPYSATRLINAIGSQALLQ